MAIPVILLMNSDTINQQLQLSVIRAEIMFVTSSLNTEVFREAWSSRVAFSSKPLLGRDNAVHYYTFFHKVSGILD